MREHDVHTGPRGLTLRVCAWGPDTGIPVLILHGFLEQGAAWHDVAQRLDRRVLAPDHRGHGCSDHVGAGGYYHFWDYVADVDALVRGLDSPVHLVGHSMGGTIATLFAASRPHAVRSLTLVEGLGPPDMTHTAVERGATFLDHLAEPRRHPVFRTAEEAAARMRRFNPRLPDATAHRLAARLLRPVTPTEAAALPDGAGTLTWRWDALHRSRAPVPFRADVHMAFLAAITAPTLLISGGTSIWQLPDHDQRMRQIPAVSHQVVPDAGHLVHLDAPDATARLLSAHFEASA